MNEKTQRQRVTGFLHTQGKKILNGNDEEILLTGWGLGNWMLCEGYMWQSMGSERFDRPARIEQVIRELTGSSYAEYFWQEFRQNYITEQDIKALAELGYNSVRIPISWRLFMADEEELIWREEGFVLLERCIAWCRKYNIYAFIDLHGAPGGQTGSNIDDSVDNVPRLFTDKDKWDKAIRLWARIAEIYRDEWIVGGYDLLNEPIRPERVDGRNFDYLLDELILFYEECIRAIRRVDQRHLLSIEGHHWATDTAVFYKKYDDNMVIHFHRYGCVPDVSSYELFLAAAERLDVPLWLGETGEAVNEWYTAMYPLALRLGIGYNIWTWKKIERPNSPFAIKKPAGWDEIIAYTTGGRHPGYVNARRILDEYLENIKVENCVPHPEVTSAVFRVAPCRVMGCDFDEPVSGDMHTCRSAEQYGELSGYRRNTGMYCVTDHPAVVKKYPHDSTWNRYALRLSAAEYADYSINDVIAHTGLIIEYRDKAKGKFEIYQDDCLLESIILVGDQQRKQTVTVALCEAVRAKIRIKLGEGLAFIGSLRFG